MNNKSTFIQSFNIRDAYVSLSKHTTTIPELNGGVGVVYRVKLQRPCSKPRVYDSMLLNNAFGIFQQLRRGLENE